MKLGLCFKCGDKWVKGHVFKFKHMKLILCEVGSDSEQDEEEPEAVVEEAEETTTLKTLQLYVTAK